jgi:hypothetical protein
VAHQRPTQRADEQLQRLLVACRRLRLGSRMPAHDIDPGAVVLLGKLSVEQARERCADRLPSSVDKDFDLMSEITGQSAERLESRA